MGRLQELRIQKGLSMRKLAEETGVSHSKISKIESGIQKISADQAVTFANYFGVTTDYLLGLSAEEIYSKFVNSYERSFLRFGVTEDGRPYGGYTGISPEMGVKIGILRYLEDINEIGDLSKIFELVATLHKKTF